MKLRGERKCSPRLAWFGGKLDKCWPASGKRLRSSKGRAIRGGGERCPIPAISNRRARGAIRELLPVAETSRVHLNIGSIFLNACLMRPPAVVDFVGSFENLRVCIQSGGRLPVQQRSRRNRASVPQAKASKNRGVSVGPRECQGWDNMSRCGGGKLSKLARQCGNNGLKAQAPLPWKQTDRCAHGSQSAE